MILGTILVAAKDFAESSTLPAPLVFRLLKINNLFCEGRARRALIPLRGSGLAGDGGRGVTPVREATIIL